MQMSLPCSSEKKHISEEEEEKKEPRQCRPSPIYSVLSFLQLVYIKLKEDFFFSSLIIKIQGEKERIVAV